MACPHVTVVPLWQGRLARYALVATAGLRGPSGHTLGHQPLVPMGQPSGGCCRPWRSWVRRRSDEPAAAHAG